MWVDHSLVRGQAQTHPGQDSGDLLLEGFGVAAGARNDQAPVIGVSDQPMVRQAVTATLPPLDRPSLGTSWFLGEELVQDREGHIAEQGRED